MMDGNGGEQMGAAFNDPPFSLCLYMCARMYASASGRFVYAHDVAIRPGRMSTRMRIHRVCIRRVGVCVLIRSSISTASWFLDWICLSLVSLLRCCV